MDRREFVKRMFAATLGVLLGPRAAQAVLDSWPKNRLRGPNIDFMWIDDPEMHELVLSIDEWLEVHDRVLHTERGWVVRDASS